MPRLVVGWYRAPVMHRPRRAPDAWDCMECDNPWPCEPARRELAGEFDPISLGILMSSYLIEAAGDLTLAPGALFDRFLRWAPRHPVEESYAGTARRPTAPATSPGSSAAPGS